MKNLLYSFIALILLSSCSTLKTTVDYDPEANFSEYTTFNFLPWSKGSDDLLSNYDKKRIRSIATQELEKLGYQKVEGNSDLVVNILIIIDEKTGTSSYNDYYTSGVGVGYYYGPWGYNYPGGVSAYTTMHSYDYEEGTMIIDLLDVKKKQLAWQGIAKKTLNSRKKGDGSAVEEAMSVLFKDFPKETK